jgi:nucleoside-diphosphate-sugar epimerase
MTDPIRRIAIVGCGWLGLPLAQRLVDLGYQVSGSKQSASAAAALTEQGIEGVSLTLTPALSCADPQRLFGRRDLIIINIPPGRRLHSPEHHKAQLAYLLGAVATHQIPKILFISSTSVYAADQGWVSEATPALATQGSGATLKQIEATIMTDPRWQASVLRFAGLVGAERHPGRFLAGKQVQGAQSPVNIIHRDDCIGLIVALIERNIWQETFNACADEHPSKSEFYTQAAQLLKMEIPQFLGDSGSSKLIDNRAIKETLNYSFRHPDPIDWLLQSKGSW